ncbi:hypothetical protein NDU88_011964, partial [Pleurodeles waltl]
YGHQDSQQPQRAGKQALTAGSTGTSSRVTVHDDYCQRAREAQRTQSAHTG